jgi:hypothetical protein
VAVASGDQPVAVCDPASGCGAAPSAEAEARRAPLRLWLAEREEISCGLAAGEPGAEDRAGWGGPRPAV